jgi:hypothetical protein
MLRPEQANLRQPSCPACSHLFHNPLNHRSKSFLVLAANSFELQTHSRPFSDEADSTTSPYFSVLHEKMKFNRSPDGAHLPRFDK